ncbi:MAG TPA: DUF2190 family protein [Thermodesulfobacteriota bacterium]
MASNYRGEGDVLPLTAPIGGVTSGSAYLISGLLVVAMDTAGQGQPFSGKTTGLFVLPKATGEAWTQCQKLYWDDTNKRLTTTASGNTLVGVAAKPAGSTDTVGEVRLDGVTR